MTDINFNQTDFQTLADSMDEIFPELVSVFIQETESSIDKLPKLIENNEWAEVRNIAHSLKSSTRTFGAIGLSEISFQIESSEDDQAEEINQLNLKFASEYEEVKKLILQLQSESN